MSHAAGNDQFDPLLGQPTGQHTRFVGRRRQILDRLDGSRGGIDLYQGELVTVAEVRA